MECCLPGSTVAFPFSGGGTVASYPSNVIGMKIGLLVGISKGPLPRRLP